MKPVCLTCATLNCNEPADNGSGFRSLLLLWPFSICAQDLFLPSLVTAALRNLISALPLLEWQPCIIYAPVQMFHLLGASGILRRWQLLPGCEIQTCSVADLCVLTAHFFICEILARISSRHWCWSATGQAPDWPPSEPPTSPLSCSWD